jgi:hypothetical protein
VDGREAVPFTRDDDLSARDPERFAVLDARVSRARAPRGAKGQPRFRSAKDAAPERIALRPGRVEDGSPFVLTGRAGGSADVKATTLLERQHRDLEQLCEVVEGGSASVRASLLPQLAGDLAAHIAVEEQLLYPAARDALRDADVLGGVDGGSALHARAIRALDRALDAAVDGEEFTSAIEELRATVAKHAREEERIFRRLEGTLEPAAMRELGASMMSLYDTKVEAGYDADAHGRAR